MEFSDGSTIPLRNTPAGDFMLGTNNMNNHVVAFGPMLSPYQPQVIALGQGKGKLLKVSLNLGEVCQKKKSKSLADSYIYTEVDFSGESEEEDQTQNDEYWNTKRKKGDIAVKAGHIVGDTPDAVEENRGAIKMGGRESKSYNQLLPDESSRTTSDTPNSEAQQQRVYDTYENMSALEVGMYALLGVFCLAVVAFMANCSVFVWRYKKRHTSEKWMNAPRGAPVQDAADWVWIGRQTLERNAVNTRCSQTLMSDADFNGNQSGSLARNGRPIQPTISRAATLPRRLPAVESIKRDGTLPSNRNSMVSTYKGSECSIRITSNPHTDCNPLLGTLSTRRARDAEQQKSEATPPPIEPPRPVMALAEQEDTSSFVSDESTPLTASSMPVESSTPHSCASSSCGDELHSSASSTSSSEDESDTSSSCAQTPLHFLNANYPAAHLDGLQPQDVQWDYEAMGMDYNQLMEYFDNLKETSA